MRTESGLVVRATVSLNDLIALTPKTQTSWVAVWRAHVPGEILSVRAFGNVILVTTSSASWSRTPIWGSGCGSVDLDEIGSGRLRSGSAMATSCWSTWREWCVGSPWPPAPRCGSTVSALTSPWRRRWERAWSW